MSISNEVRKAWGRRREPLVTDRGIDVAFFWLWALYAGWGWSSAVVNTTILNIPITFYPTYWGAGIGLSATIACGAIMASFFLAGDQFTERIAQKWIEITAVTIMGMLISVHPILQILRLVAGQDSAGEPMTIDRVILAFSYLVMPIFRIALQLGRAQTVKAARERYIAGEEQRPETS